LMSSKKKITKLSAAGSGGVLTKRYIPVQRTDVTVAAPASMKLSAVTCGFHW